MGENLYLVQLGPGSSLGKGSGVKGQLLLFCGDRPLSYLYDPEIHRWCWAAGRAGDNISKPYISAGSVLWASQLAITQKPRLDDSWAQNPWIGHQYNMDGLSIGHVKDISTIYLGRKIIKWIPTTNVSAVVLQKLPPCSQCASILWRSGTTGYPASRSGILTRSI